MDRLVVIRRGNRVYTAVVSDGKVGQLMSEPDTAGFLLGNTYIGKVQGAVSNINAAFADTGPGCTGHYSLQERWRPERLKTGDELVMQISKNATRSKTPVITECLSFTGRYCALTMGKTRIGFFAKIHNASCKARLRELLKCDLAGTKDPGIIIRTNAVTVKECAMREELTELMWAWQRLPAETGCRVCYSCLYRTLPGYIATIQDSFGRTLEEIITDVPEYHGELKAYLEMYQKEDARHLTPYGDSLLPLGKPYSLETAFEKASDESIWLKSGGYLATEPTEAVTVINANTGKYPDRKRIQGTMYKINMEAADKIGRRIRLRDFSGIIIMDFINMERREGGEALLTHLVGVVSRDPVKTMVVDMTTLNLMELTRKEVRKSLHEQV